MAEYIKREALMVALCKEITGEGDYYNGKDDMQDQIRDMVSQFPPAHVVPVRHGRWEDKPNPQWKAYDIRYCSACGWSIHKSKLRNADLNWAYCPSCGARMDGGDANA